MTKQRRSNKSVRGVETDKAVEESQVGRYSTSETPQGATWTYTSMLSDIDDMKLLQLNEAFKFMDADKDGVLNAEDLLSTFLTLGEKSIQSDYIKNMLREAPTPLDLHAFIFMFGHKTIELGSRGKLRDALVTCVGPMGACDNSGIVGIRQDRLRDALETWSDKLTATEVDACLSDAPTFQDARGHCMIDCEQFAELISGLRK